MEKLKIEIVRRDTDFDIKNVKLFEVTGKAEKGIKMTEDNVKSFIDNHEKFKTEKGYLPTVFVGHNSMMTSEGEAIGFFDNIRMIGQEVYVDFVNIFGDWFEKLKRYPYRSMEIYDGQITGIAVLGSNPPYFMSEPLMYSKSDDDKRESYFLPVYSEHDDHAGKGADEKTYFISPNNNSLMEFTKENFEQLAKDKADAEARATQFQKDAEDAKAKAQTLEKEKADQAVFAQVGSEIEKFAKNGKIAFSNDEDKESAKKFASSLPDEDARKAFFALLSKLVAVKTATKEFGADEGGSDDDGGEDKDKGDEAKQEAEAQKEADQFMKDGKYTNRADALAAAYKKLGIVQ